MGSMGYAKTGEGVLITAAMLSERLASATVYYNGQSITSGAGWGFDTQPFDDVLCAINVGTILGPLATLINAVYESDTDDPTAATAITGADFTSCKNSSDDQVRRASILCKDTKRYLFLRTELQGTPVTVDFGAMWVAGQARSQATAQHLEFDV